MRPQPKTIKIIIYPDGSTSPITRSSRGWAWYPPKGGKWESSDLRGVADNAAQYGGRIETRPNPNYRTPTGLDIIRKHFRIINP